MYRRVYTLYIAGIIHAGYARCNATHAAAAIDVGRYIILYCVHIGIWYLVYNIPMRIYGLPSSRRLFRG